MKQIRKRLTFANVLACLALFIALGGASYAATQLPKNRVGTNPLKKNAVTGAKVKNGSLTAADFKAGQLPAGPEGKEGKEGKQGPIGPSDLYSATGAFKTIATSEVRYPLVSLTLPPGEYQVIASQTTQPSGATYGELDCYIFADTTEEASFYARIPENMSGNVTGMASLTLTATTTVSDRCTAFNTSMIVPQPKLVALKVGSIH